MPRTTPRTMSRTATPPPFGSPNRSASSTPTTSAPMHARSEEHTSELQSRRELVCRLLLEKKKREPPPLLAPCHSFLYASGAPRALPSFPTRRSSDLSPPRLGTPSAFP